MRAAVVVPALDEERTIGDIVEAATRHGDVIVVDDGSTDATATIAAAAGATVIRHESNLGYDAALASGLEWARAHGYFAAVTIDADGQLAPDIIGGVLGRLDAGADLVLGCRERGARWSEWVFSLYTRARFGIRDVLCGVKGYRLAALPTPSTSRRRTVGTGAALAMLRLGRAPCTVVVHVSPRQGNTRFGSGLGPNFRIMRALAYAVADDARALLRRGSFAR